MDFQSTIGASPAKEPLPEAQLLQMQRESTSSIEVTRNAKGDYQWVLKRYYDADGQSPEGFLATDAQALEDIKRIDAELRQHFLGVAITPEPDDSGLPF